ncbi:MAG: hypothetical protein IKQ05_04740 [Prevotella sp.]|nr:hypothetical protein [Prevotella sp.]
MMSRQSLRAYIIYIIMLLCPLGMGAQSLTQNSISTIAKSDPLIITGAIGTQNTYYNSSVGAGYRSPWSNTLSANLNIQLYGISMPFAFFYSNNNRSFSFPHFSFHIDPTYKNWRGHLGRSSMGMSNYIMNMSFDGIGLEYNSSKLRCGIFYGELRNAINDDPTDPGARSPQYRRMGWGLKVGYGSGQNYLDLYLLSAKDRKNSIDEYWQEQISPQENVAIGLKGGLGVTKWLSLRGNLAFSAFSHDYRAERIKSATLDKWDKIFEARYSSLMRIAGDISANLRLKNFNTQISYRMVQPDYTTLGLYYCSNNFQSLGINMSTSLFKKLSLSANFSGQEDNITRNQLYTTRGFVYSANASMAVNEKLQVTASYSGYRQVQSDGTAHVNDTTRVNRVMHSFTLTPSYSLTGDHFDHIFSLSASYTQNKDLNKFATGESDVKTLAAGLSYNLGLKDWEMDVTTSLSHQQSKGYNTKYTSEVFSVGTGRSFLKEKNLNVSADLSLCYNNVQNQQRMLSIGTDLSAGYTLLKDHVFSFSANFNKYSDTNLSADMSSYGASEITLSLGYTYTFSLMEIKRKADKKAKSEK